MGGIQMSSRHSRGLGRSKPNLTYPRYKLLLLLLLLLLQMSWITVLPSHSCGGTLQNLDIKLLHGSMQTSADHRSGRRHVSRMTDEKEETWSPSGMSKVRSISAVYQHARLGLFKQTASSS